MKYTPQPEEEITDEDEELYDIVMSKELSPAEKIRSFIELDSGTIIPLNQLESYLKDPLNL